jgi:HD superfamily phosphohydrolase
MSKRSYASKKDPLDQVEALDKAQELFVPVHGHVLVYPEEIAIIDHPSFQRLRRVRQLGLAHMVFPGASHTRFEHSVGAVHVAQMIINHINHNFRKSESSEVVGDWSCAGVDYPTARFIRLGALLHDIGHLPFGHTLEDELGHLRSHDGNERLSLVAERKSEQYEVCRALVLEATIERPEGGWTLKGLVNALYRPFAQTMSISVEPFVLLSHIVCKKPKEKVDEWNLTRQQIEESVDLEVCRDIVGNTICADFLDYLYRDWHHLGKPLYNDVRLYQYMEVRSHRPGIGGEDRGTKFVINIGPREKIRHDALTDILELLNARYKLAETVLFHRTKLSLTGVLDRCLLEIGELYEALGLPEDRHKVILENLLLESSDDGLVGILKKLVAGGSNEIKRKLQQALKAERDALEVQTGESPSLYDRDAGAGGSHGKEGETPGARSEARVVGPIEAQMNLIRRLIDRLQDREVYTLGYKLRMNDFNAPHNLNNQRLSNILNLYDSPRHRLNFLRGVEAMCGLPSGSIVMYCPHDAKMNAKIAEVNLLIEGAVSPFATYEEAQRESGLTRGALIAQVNRFYELWSAHVFIERSCWDRLKPSAQENLRSVLKCFFFQMDPTTDLKIVREQIDCSVDVVRNELLLPTFRAVFGNPPPVQKFKDFKFPSGLAFDIHS